MQNDLHKGDILTADYVRQLVSEVRRNKPIAGNGLTYTVTPYGTTLSVRQSVSRPSVTKTPDFPKPFDILKVENGQITVGYLTYQLGSQVKTQSGTLSIPAPSSVTSIMAKLSRI